MSFFHDWPGGTRRRRDYKVAPLPRRDRPTVPAVPSLRSVPTVYGLEKKEAPEGASFEGEEGYTSRPTLRKAAGSQL
jgi:hypothetical protein